MRHPCACSHDGGVTVYFTFEDLEIGVRRTETASINRTHSAVSNGIGARAGVLPSFFRGSIPAWAPSLLGQFPLRYSPSTKLRWGFNSRSSGAPQWTYVSAGRASRPTIAFYQCNKRWWLPCVCCTDVRSGHCLGIGAHIQGISASFTALFSGCVLHCAVAYSGARLPALSR